VTDQEWNTEPNYTSGRGNIELHNLSN